MDKKYIHKIMDTLKLNHFSLVLGKTDVGDLAFKVTKEQPEGFFTLDSVPVHKDTNYELIKLLM